MSEAAVAAPADVRKQVLGVTDGKMAMWIFLGSDGMSFMGLIAAYIVLRFNNLDVWPSPGEYLGIQLTAFNTFVLICSSVTMVKAFEGALANDVPKLKKYLLLTILGGASFLGGACAFRRKRPSSRSAWHVRGPRNSRILSTGPSSGALSTAPTRSSSS